jgi:membrane carboxypeptidase/penicillin-binding protein PbpC
VETIISSFGLEIPADAHLLRDDFDVSPLSLAQAYGIFANSGVQAGQITPGNDLQPVSVLKITGADHSIWEDWAEPQNRSVVSPQLAYIVNQVLSDETARWPSLGHPNPLEIGRAAGAKISPSLDSSGAWTVGYTPQLVAVVWLGGGPASDQEARAFMQVADLSAEVWHALMQSAVSALPAEGWEAPAGVITASVCDPSGLLPTAACPNVVNEVFLEGRQPVQADNLYETVKVNIETGLLATVFTQPELVEDRTYMVVPSNARAWAVSAGIPIPPATYDTVQKPPLLPDVHITTPEMFADKRGSVEIRGSAAGEDFLSYRLEYGQGLYPQKWFQIGGDNSVPVNEGLLGTWDTKSLNGLYALRLMVVRQDQRVAQALVQVTLDNTPPQLAIMYPAEGQAIDLEQESHIALQAQAGDPFLVGVEFYVDGVLIGKSTEPPFGLVWNARKGAHTLRVVASDRAGNQTEASLHFSVK